MEDLQPHTAQRLVYLGTPQLFVLLTSSVYYPSYATFECDHLQDLFPLVITSLKMAALVFPLLPTVNQAQYGALVANSAGEEGLVNGIWNA